MEEEGVECCLETYRDMRCGEMMDWSLCKVRDGVNFWVLWKSVIIGLCVELLGRNLESSWGLRFRNLRKIGLQRLIEKYQVEEQERMGGRWEIGQDL